MTIGTYGMSEVVMREYISFMSGEFIGKGSSREVYEHPTDKSKVIKVENSKHYFQNVIEWEVWNDFGNCKKTSIWLAPCHSISDNGIFLIMDKVRDAAPFEIPLSIPEFLTDHKPSNFGMLNGKFVCRDYGHIIFDLKLTRKKWEGHGRM